MEIRYIVKQLRTRTGLTQVKFAEKFFIPKHNVETWEMGIRKPPMYVVKMIETILDLEEKVKGKEDAKSRSSDRNKTTTE